MHERCSLYVITVVCECVCDCPLSRVVYVSKHKINGGRPSGSTSTVSTSGDRL